MIRKIIKYTLRTLLCVTVALIVLPFLLYIPGIQNVIKREAESYLSQHTPIQLSVRQIRLSFPLDLTVDDVWIGHSTADTLLLCKRLEADIALWPLLRREIEVRKFTFTEASVHYTDSLTHFGLRGDIKHFSLKTKNIDFKTKTAAISAIHLEEGRVALSLGKSSADTIPNDTTRIAWKMEAQTVNVQHVDFTLTAPDVHVQLAQGIVQQCVVDMRTQQVWVNKITLHQGNYTFRNDPSPVTDTLARDTTLSMPWAITANQILLSDNSVTYEVSDQARVKGLDVNHIVLCGLNLSADSLFNRGKEFRVGIRSFSATEQSGATITSLHGLFLMDSTDIKLENFQLTTPRSSIQAEVQTATSLRTSAPQTPIHIALTAQVDLEELLLFFPYENKNLQKTLAGRVLTLKSDFSGTLNQLHTTNQVTIPGHLHLSLDGEIESLTARSHLQGLCRVRGNFSHFSFLSALLPESLRHRIQIPESMTLNGSLGLRQETFTPVVTLAVESGTLTFKGSFNKNTQRYKAELVCDSFPMHRFLPSDSLGHVTMQLMTHGTGVKFLRTGTTGELALRISQFNYRHYNYGEITLNASLQNHLLSGQLSGQSQAFRFGFDIRGELMPTLQSLSIQGRVDSCNLHRMNLLSQRISTSFQVDASVSTDSSRRYKIDLALDQIHMHDRWQQTTIRKTTLFVVAAPHGVMATVQSGDLHVDFETSVSADSLFSGLNRSVDVITKQIEQGRVDMEGVNKVLPSFQLKGSSGKNNIINGLLQTQGIQFDALSLSILSNDSLPFTTHLQLYKLARGSILLDTATFALKQQARQLNYQLHLANNPNTPEHVSMISLAGHIIQNQVQLQCLQKNRQGERGFDFGLQISLADSIVTLHMLENPILGFHSWEVNPNNYVAYHLNRRLFADFMLSRATQEFSVKSVLGQQQGTVNLHIAGIDMASTLNLFLGAPPFGGTFNTDVLLTMQQDSIRMEGKASITQSTYKQQPVADIELLFGYVSDPKNDQQFNTQLLLDGTEALTLKGSYQPAISTSPLSATLVITQLPLNQANVFIPADAARLSGALQGELTFLGTIAKPIINGTLQLAQTQIQVPMIGTTFGIAPEKIILQDSKAYLANYKIIAPNQTALNINGTIDLSDFTQIMTDVQLSATDFQCINVAKNRNSTVYGTGYMDLNTSIRGAIHQLTIRGGVDLLRGTEINYVMRDAMPGLRNRAQNLVTFVSWNDTITPQISAPTQQLTLGGIDMLLNINLDNAVRMAVNLSEDGENRIDLQGGGNLTYTLNPLGDSHLSGKYVVTTGSVRYNPPILSEKIFNITPGSYVEWTGELADPTLHITAIETIRTNVTTDNEQNNSRPVNFDLSITIRNALDNLDVAFGLSAPEDLTIQNQLSSLTAEQRANQAMNLLLYNTYSGPGTTAKANTSNPLNSFIQKELNQWAQNSLKGVDLSFGIDTYDDHAISGISSRTDYSYRLSKNLFNNRVKAVIGGKFSTDPDPNENSTENLIDDISVEYQLTKRNNMFLKLFMQTGYESILEGEVTETGLGFVIRKKMLKITDLFRMMHNKVQSTKMNHESNPKP